MAPQQGAWLSSRCCVFLRPWLTPAPTGAAFADMARRGLRRKYWEDEEDLQANGKRKGRGRRGRNRGEGRSRRALAVPVEASDGVDKGSRGMR